MSFELDDGADATPGSFDDHSVTISSDALGTFKFSGNGGSSAVSALDATAAGDIWDTFDGTYWCSSAEITAAGNAAMLTQLVEITLCVYSYLQWLMVYLYQLHTHHKDLYWKLLSIWINIYWSRRFIS